jgi:hypothetical protein
VRQRFTPTASIKPPARFDAFSMIYLHQPVTWNRMVGFARTAIGVFVVFRAPISNAAPRISLRT